jgi:hypothetical protein
MKEKAFIVSAVANALLMSALAGCESRELPKEEVRPVDWYLRHESERAKKLVECQSKPGTLDATPNCINASRAENEARAPAKWATDKEGVRTEPPVPVYP